ncbi:hypothetical protein [Aliterella atlantica]|uniref:Uncharacterized protein n=1 Tax=Aliterella atlantica CENA595 TaxID=1618023 RepID=A0A0D8ZLI5_9CYAN|nr:hypothetical protein [Aliterella atlantica]KJH69605.1 hypothetical protein UH38_23015 [Aliterella atlantica CENA595]
MSDGREANRLRHRIQALKERIAQLEAELRAMRRQTEAQRQRIAHKYGDEFLALIDGDPDARVTVTDIVQRLVFQDEEGNVVSETDSSLVGKVIQVRFRSLH